MGRPWRRPVATALAAALLAGIAAVVFVVLRPGDERSDEPALGTPDVPDHLEPLSSPLVPVASGHVGGDAWELLAFTIRGPGSVEICVSFRLPADEERGALHHCLGHVPRDGYPDLYDVQRWSSYDGGDEPPVTAFYGVTQPTTTAVEIVPPDGELIQASVFGPFRLLEAEVKFFVGFAPPRTAAEVIGRDGRETLWLIPPIEPFPLISVYRSGAGEGTVEGYAGGRRVEGLPASARGGLAIECGLDCVDPHAPGDPARFVFEAHPDPGSRFAGWLGMCAGQGRICTIEPPDGNVRIGGVFEPA